MPIPTFLVPPEVVWPDQMVGVCRALAACLQGTELGQGGGGWEGGEAGWRGRETRPGGGDRDKFKKRHDSINISYQ